jgi:hypothetical protein
MKDTSTICMEKEKKDDINEILKPKLPTEINKEVKVQSNKAGEGFTQCSIRLPQDFVDELDIKKGDIFLIHLNPETKEYSIKLKEKKHGKKTDTSNR